MPVAEHTLIIAPAGHLPHDFPQPKKGDESSWWDMSGERPRPLQMEVKFHYGEAEVSDEVGRYMVATGLAQKSRLVLPNSWSR